MNLRFYLHLTSSVTPGNLLASTALKSYGTESTLALATDVISYISVFSRF